MAGEDFEVRLSKRASGRDELQIFQNEHLAAHDVERTLKPKPDSRAWEALLLDVASGKIDREETTKRLRKLTRV